MTEQFDVFLAHNSVDKPLVREITANFVQTRYKYGKMKKT